jgi:hypothetical protein
MMDSKQLSLVYLMEEANRMAGVCTKNVHALDKKNSTKALEKQMGVLFSAMREVVEEFKLNESNVQTHAESEYERRSEER